MVEEVVVVAEEAVEKAEVVEEVEILEELGTVADATVVGAGEGAGVEGVEEASCSWCRAALCLPRSRSAGPR